MPEKELTYEELLAFYRENKEKVKQLEQENSFSQAQNNRGHSEFEKLILHPANKQFLNSLPLIFYQIDIQGNFLFLNDFAIREFDINPDYREKGLNIIDLLYDPADFEKFKERFNKNIKEQNLKRSLYKFKKKDGSLFQGLVYATNWIPEGNTPSAFGIVIDHTEYHEIQEQLKEANRTKDLLYSIIAHDLKNPFNAISGFSELILAGTDTYSKEKIIDFVKIIYQSSVKGYSLLENLLEWSKLHSGKLITQKETFRLKSLIIETIDLHIEKAKSKNIALKFRCLEELYVHADKNMTRTILRNLVFNALKFTEDKGEINITAEKYKKDTSKALISVKDTGIGIKEEKIPLLFDVDKIHTTFGTKQEKGSGLGLLLCKDFVTKNDGDIWVDSTPGKGTTFFFTLPLAAN